MTPRALRASAFALLFVSGCASSIVVSTPPVTKQAPAGLVPPPVRLGNLAGPSCFAQAVAEYLATPGGLQLAAGDGPPGLILSGAATRIEVHSNRGDKEVALRYFTAFVVTAPIAAAMYGAKDWHADAAADGELVATDAAGATIWKKSLTVSVAESQRTMPTEEALNTAMTSAVCAKLATTLLNGLTEHLAARH
jgi:hypothetical protein